MTMLFDPPATPAVPVIRGDSLFPVRRIFCVGRNYEAHAREMGFAPEREAPIWFTKSPAALCAAGGMIPYPPGTRNCHYEMEFVVAIAGSGFRVDAADAMALVFGYACGLDLTRRDLQNAAKAKGFPWDTGKDFENAAVIGPITRAADFGIPAAQRIWLKQNGTIRQDAVLSDMIWSVAELVADLSGMYHLAPGDLIYTGTPAGVGPIAPKDLLESGIDGLAPISLRVGEPE
ncbi:fumarylacetoacetate hydrolase family protein [Novosphingobium sp. RD2P27]|uniref:Fumarylacetoacetate hydrolase family protein n=1 Tax=Novosphingobium kalidii TaxID=3230299 RepID=A0ABV2D1R2_9SPHN